jgi:hypothetical protein
VLKDVPHGTEVGIDMQAWNTGDRFLGIKLIPPGIHFLYYSAVNTGDRSTAPRFGGFFTCWEYGGGSHKEVKSVGYSVVCP